jgi:hypothetical protein
LLIRPSGWYPWKNTAVRINYLRQGIINEDNLKPHNAGREKNIVSGRRKNYTQSKKELNRHILDIRVRQDQR